MYLLDTDRAIGSTRNRDGRHRPRHLRIDAISAKIKNLYFFYVPLPLPLIPYLYPLQRLHVDRAATRRGKRNQPPRLLDRRDLNRTPQRALLRRR